LLRPLRLTFRPGLNAARLRVQMGNFTLAVFMVVLVLQISDPLMVFGCAGEGIRRSFTPRGIAAGIPIARVRKAGRRKARTRSCRGESRSEDRAPVGSGVAGSGFRVRAQRYLPRRDVWGGAGSAGPGEPGDVPVTGYPEEQLLAMRLTDLTHPEHLGAHRERFAHLAAGTDVPAEAERRWVHADGHDIWVQFHVATMRVWGMRYLVGLVEDITARKEAEQRLSHLALHDALTQLPNRVLLLDRLEHALRAGDRSGKPVGVLYVDLDGFKLINDTAGHLIGDELLIMAAGRLRDHIRPGDTVARIGGDEFVVVCPDLHDAGNAGTVAGRLLTALREPFVHAGQAYRITASMGLAVSSPGSTAQALLREADDAMYAAKDDGKDPVHRAQDADVSRTARAARHVLVETELGVALDHDELIMYGQPVLDLETGRIVAVETLLRWAHPHRGVLAPAEFLDVAETSPLMTAIGRRVLLEACRLAAGWPTNTSWKPAGGVCQYLRPATRSRER
jgi:diguanylate cyclase (GGDEF)-like protein/PAS domain S-box-containing protein